MARVDPLVALGIAREEQDAEVLSAHLTEFVDAFVVCDSRTRVHNLMKRARHGKVGRRWFEVLGLIESRLDREVCRPWDEQSRPDTWPAAVAKRGLYIAEPHVALEMTLDEASRLWIHETTDAVFSIVPGRLAVFLNHEWGVFYCERTD